MDEHRAKLAVFDLLDALGEDPGREGLRGTPGRVARAWGEMLDGMGKSATDVLLTSEGTAGFTQVGGYDQMVVLTGYPFHSVCEHHLLPFQGLADVGYVPSDGGPMVGLSKLGRLVDLYARRLQVQERLTQQVAESLEQHLRPLGVGVRIRAVHQCMACRGVRKGSTMATEALLGAFRKHEVRAEFWHLCSALEVRS